MKCDKRVFFCGFCQEGEAADLERGFETSLEAAGIAATRLMAGPLRIWVGQSRPRAFSVVASGDGTGVVVGELLWERPNSQPRTAEQDSARLAAALSEGRPEDAVAANGSFAFLYFDRRAGRLWLMADSLGSRPVYVHESRGAVFFSTVLDLLLRHPAVPRVFDFAAFAEQSAFCYPLGGATLYRDIRVLQDSEYLAWSNGSSSRRRYFDWPLLELRQASLEEAAESCRQAFEEAVADRSPGAGEIARVLLSGGLDSRSVAAALQRSGVRVEAATLSVEGSLDAHYARRVAAVMGIPLTETAWDPASTPVVTGHATAAALSAAARPFGSSRVFTGDGGGETFGFLLMPAEVMSLMGRGQQDAAMRAWLHGHGAPPRVFRQPWRRIIEQRPLEAMGKAMQRFSRLPGQKAFHLFIVLNDLRRHLHDAYEASARTGLDIAAPFYDRRVLQSVLSLAPPLDPYLGHRLYHEIVRHWPDACFRVPWQTYPGHLPCPVADPPETTAGLRDQWEVLQQLNRRTGGVRRRWAVKSLASGRAPARLLNLPLLTTAILGHRLRLFDRSHLFAPVEQLACCIHPGSEIAGIPAKGK
jgi:asparagine synthetase B (glutamine-hydrolysing)